MAINTTPTYTKSGQIGWSWILKTDNTALDWTWTVATLFTAWADWGRVEKIRIRHIGTNIQTVLRIFINNGGTNATIANNTLFAELTIPANTVSQTTQSVNYELPQILGFTSSPTDISSFPLVLPPWYKLLATVGTTIVSWLHVTAVWGNLTA